MASRELTSILIQPESIASPTTPQEVSAKLGVGKELANQIAELSNTPRADILNDVPTAEDAFGFGPLARTLANVVLSETTQTPLTICVNGKWGTGKTSILRMIEAQARMLGYPCIWLNAWSLETTENLFASVASEVQQEIKYRPQRKSSLLNKWVEWLVQVQRGILSVSGSAVLGLAGGTAGVVKASLQREEEIEELASIITTRRSFERLVNELLDKEHSRMIVFVDDIDRALPDQIANVLKNLKLLLEVSRCVFILGMDVDVVARAIREYYRNATQNISMVHVRGDLVTRSGGRLTIATGSQGMEQDTSEDLPQDFGHNYLDKLIQIKVDVPPVTRSAVCEYLNKMAIAPEIIEIIQWAPDEDVLNPRSLKRYVNWLSISLQLIMAVRMPSRISNVWALKALALRRDYPAIYDYLQGRMGKSEIGIATVEFIRQNLDRLYGKMRNVLRSAGMDFLDRFLGESYPQIYGRSEIQKSIEPLLTHLERYYPAVMADAIARLYSSYPTLLEISPAIDHYAAVIAVSALLKGGRLLTAVELQDFLLYLDRLDRGGLSIFEKYIHTENAALRPFLSQVPEAHWAEDKDI